MKRLIPVLALSFVALLALSAHAANRRVYMLGNSLTDDVLYDGFASIVANGNDTLTLGSHRTPGAPVYYLWNNPASTFSEPPYGFYPNAFANYTWDAVTLQPFSTYSNELQFARYFAQALRGEATFGIPNNADNIFDTPHTPAPGEPTGISPNATVYLYAQWPDKITDQWKSAAWLATDYTTINSAAYFDALVPQLRTLEPKTQFFLIPAGHVFHELYQQSRAGRFPGVSRQYDLMSDERHLNDRGSYVPALTFYSVIYKRDPRGMQAPARYGVTAQQAAVIQAAVWKVVSNHPLSGIATSLVITTPSLPDVVEDKAFSTAFSSALANGTVSWSVTPGYTLPAGLALGTNGTLSGTVANPGIYDFSVRATDTGGAVADRAYILFVASNNPPIISTTALPAAPYGQPYKFLLTRTAGVGDVSWSLPIGDLPHGLSLNADGSLSGTPLSLQGTFNLTFRVTDSTGAYADKSLPLTVAAPGDATLVAAPTHVAPTINGALAESIWSSLPNEAARRVYGPSDNTVTFAVRHDASALYVGVRVLDANVMTGDAVHVFIDGLHDREAVFNADDRHIVVTSAGAVQELNGRGSGITAAATAISGGYSVELRVPLSNLSLDDGLASHSVGFDLGVEDVDTTGASPAWQVWRAAHPDDPSPAVFGNLVLAGAPIGTNILTDSSFDAALLKFAYPAAATADMANQGWVANNVSTRPFAVVDKLGYGYPAKAIVSSGAGTSTCLYQVVKNDRAATGRGFLRFDVKWADTNTAVRLFAYNGDAATVTSQFGTQSQQHPILGGTPAATLVSTTLGSIPASATWREGVIPVDFGSGYDYYVIGFSSAADKLPVDARIDNIQLGALVPQQTISAPSSAITYADWVGMIPWTTAADSAPTADPDGDGLNNLLEYALLTDPLSPNAAPTTLGKTATSLTLSYLRARSDVTYSVETSTDLQTWTTTGVTQTVAPVGGTATASVDYDPATAPRRFLRLRATR